MATTTYLSLTDALSAVTLNCPSLIMAEAIKQTVIDLCERGQIWRYTHPDIALVASDYSYSFSPPDSDTVISLVKTARVDDVLIDIVTPENAIVSFPKFPDAINVGEPNTLWQIDQRSFFVAPTPDTSYTLKLTTTLKPTVTSTGADTTVIQEHLETINHGALHRLLLQQKRDWFNSNLAGYHGKQYTYKLNLLKAQAVKGYGRTSISTAMRPFA